MSALVTSHSGGHALEEGDERRAMGFTCGQPAQHGSQSGTSRIVRRRRSPGAVPTLRTTGRAGKVRGIVRDVDRSHAAPRRDRPPPHGPLLVVMLGLVTAIGPLSLDMYLPAFPAIADDLACRPRQVQLSLTTCLIGLAARAARLRPAQRPVGPAAADDDRRGGVRRLLRCSARWPRRAPLLAGAAPAAGLRRRRRRGGGPGDRPGPLLRAWRPRSSSPGSPDLRAWHPIAAPQLGSAVLRVTSWRGIFVALGVIGAAADRAAGGPSCRRRCPPGRRSRGGLRDTRATARTLLADRVFLGYALPRASPSRPCSPTSPDRLVRAAGRLRLLAHRCSACCSG